MVEEVEEELLLLLLLLHGAREGGLLRATLRVSVCIYICVCGFVCAVADCKRFISTLWRQERGNWRIGKHNSNTLPSPLSLPHYSKQASSHADSAQLNSDPSPGGQASFGKPLGVQNHDEVFVLNLELP